MTAASSVQLTDAEIWEGFRSLPVEGEDLYHGLRRHLAESGFFKLEGDTLELGAGDGFLWRAEGSRLIDLATARGGLLLTDNELSCIERFRTADDLRRSGVTFEQVDAAQLPYASTRFARVLAVHVLHWCPTLELLHAAIAELTRVMRVDGRVAVVTVDEHVHMAQLYTLMRVAKSRLETRGLDLGVTLPDRPPRIGRFCAGNAEGLLRAGFRHVQRVDFDYAHRVERAHPGLPLSGAEFVARYLRTAPYFKESGAEPNVLEAFFAEAQRMVDTAIREDGVFSISRRDVLYECAAPHRPGRE